MFSVHGLATEGVAGQTIVPGSAVPPKPGSG